MRVIDPGHVYELDWLDKCDGPEMELQPYEDGHRQSELIFVKREGDGYPGNVGHHPGTNLQEVLRACIDRVKYLDVQIPDRRNDFVLTHLRAAIWDLEWRAAERHGRPFDVDIVNIELRPTCPHCGHVGCGGTCRGHESTV